MAMTVTIVLSVQDNKFDKTKHVTATAGQESRFRSVGEVAQEALAKTLGPFAGNQVSLTSVTAA